MKEEEKEKINKWKYENGCRFYEFLLCGLNTKIHENERKKEMWRGIIVAWLAMLRRKSLMIQVLPELGERDGT